VATCTDAEPNARGFDIAHVFNLRTIEATERQVAALVRYGVPIVMSPIYLEISQALWGSTAVGTANGKKGQNYYCESIKRFRRSDPFFPVSGLPDRALCHTRNKGRRA
jgi:hypothetical protein